MTGTIRSLVRPDPQAGNTWLQRALQAGFWFFLAKGLLWLTVPAMLHQVLAD
jgi:hypothetical protein